MQNWIKIHTKVHQIAPFKKIYRGSCPRTPLTKRMVSPCTACRFATYKFPSLKKKIIGPPPPKSWVRPCITEKVICVFNYIANNNLIV